MTTLERLQRWYRSMCNGDWEHTYGVFISNIDNPGWRLRVELADTYLLDASFESIQVQREDEDDWYVCQKKGEEFIGSGGPGNLDEVIQVFLDWAEGADPEREV